MSKAQQLRKSGCSRTFPKTQYSEYLSRSRRNQEGSLHIQRGHPWVRIHARRIRYNLTNAHLLFRMPPSKYIETISKSTSWGGAIELGILAAHYGTEIASVDVETGRIDKFSPPAESFTGEGSRCIIIYSGIHYDAVSFSPMEDAPDEWHQKMFPIVSVEHPDNALRTLTFENNGCQKPGKDEDDSILVAVKRLADILRSKKAFTNTATFDLRCEVGPLHGTRKRYTHILD